MTHDPLEALVLADQLVVLEGGRIVQEGGRADGSRVTLSGGGVFAVPDRGQHGDVLIAVRPSAVVVSSQRPAGGSARNAWPGRIAGLTLLADRIRLDLDGPPPALVDLTPAAVAELSLRPGGQVWLKVKATDLEIYPRADSRAS